LNRGERASLAAYRELAIARPTAFRNPDPAGVVIILENEERCCAETGIRERLRADGLPVEWAEAGLFYEDRWLWMVRDVVRFPDGEFGTYHRIVLKGGEQGVIVIPVYDGRIVLLRHFRHGARGWSIEVPRGAPESGTDTDELARIELGEECGGRVESLAHVGCINSNSGLITVSMQVYVASLESFGAPNVGEGIVATYLVSPAELEEWIGSGKVTDANTIAGFALARIRGLL